MKAFLVLENGSFYEGTARAAHKKSVFKIVFNTSMAGYLEILSDPANKGLGVLMTYPIIGGYGVQPDDKESDLHTAAAFIVRELCSTPSNFRSEGTLEELLIRADIPCIEGIDTRKIVQTLRDEGTMKAALVYDISNLNSIIKEIKEYKEPDAVKSVSCNEIITSGRKDADFTVACLDLGTANSLTSPLHERNCRIVKYPYNTKAEKILSGNYDGILLTGGPGDPRDYNEITAQIKILAESGKPIFAKGLGHQLLALSQGGGITQLAYGHHGANLPVRNKESGRTVITSQNHCFAVDPKLIPTGAVVSAENVNDGSVEALRYKDRQFISIQFTPASKASAEQNECEFDTFVRMMGGKANA